MNNDWTDFEKWVFTNVTDIRDRLKTVEVRSATIATVVTVGITLLVKFL